MIVKTNDAEVELAMEDVRQFVGEDHAATRFDKLVFLDVADHLEAKSIQTQLRSMEHTVYSSRPFGPAITIDLGEATDQSLAAREQLNGYLQTSPLCRIIPPWHKEHLITADQAERRKHVATLARYMANIAISPENQSLYDKVDELYDAESPDHERILDLGQQADRLRRENAIATVLEATQHGELRDLPTQFVNDYLKIVDPGPEQDQLSRETEFVNWQQGMAEFGASLGQLPLVEDVASYEDRCFDCTGMIFTHDEDQHIRMNLRFNDPSVAIPHLVAWLEEHGIDDVRLRVEKQMAVPMFEDLLDEP